MGRDFELGHTKRQIHGKTIRQATITLIVSPVIDRYLTVERQAQRLHTTVLHEMGHALGLEHSEHPQDVMYHRGWQHRYLSQNDSQRVVTLYEKDAWLTV